MRQLLLPLLLVSLSACAAAPVQPESPLYDTYQHYRQAVADNQILAKRNEFFTDNVLNDLDINTSWGVRILGLASEVAKGHSHYESINGDHGCLTVNGNTTDDNFVSVSLEYVLKDKHWLINSQMSDYWEPQLFKGFADKAMCPKDAEKSN